MAMPKARQHPARQVAQKAADAVYTTARRRRKRWLSRESKLSVCSVAAAAFAPATERASVRLVCVQLDAVGCRISFFPSPSRGILYPRQSVQGWGRCTGVAHYAADNRAASDRDEMDWNLDLDIEAELAERAREEADPGTGLTTE